MAFSNHFIILTIHIKLSNGKQPSTICIGLACRRARLRGSCGTLVSLLGIPLYATTITLL